MSYKERQSPQISSYRRVHQSYASLNPNPQSTRLELSDSMINNSKNNENERKFLGMPSISEVHSNNTFGSQESSNSDIDTSLLISPIILKAFTSLNQYGLKKDSLKMIENRLKDKLEVLRRYHKNFENRMDELIEIANEKEKFAQNLIAPKSQFRDTRKTDFLKQETFFPMAKKPETRNLPLQYIG